VGRKKEGVGGWYWYPAGCCRRMRTPEPGTLGVFCWTTIGECRCSLCFNLSALIWAVSCGECGKPARACCQKKSERNTKRDAHQFKLPAILKKKQNNRTIRVLPPRRRAPERSSCCGARFVFCFVLFLFQNSLEQTRLARPVGTRRTKQVVISLTTEGERETERK